MPSYRDTMTVGSLRPGVSPASVLPAAAEAAGLLATVEASDIAVVSGTARLTVRFTCDDPSIARQIGEWVVASVSALADIPTFIVTERVGTRWHAVT